MSIWFTSRRRSPLCKRPSIGLYSPGVQLSLAASLKPRPCGPLVNWTVIFLPNFFVFITFKLVDVELKFLISFVFSLSSEVCPLGFKRATLSSRSRQSAFEATIASRSIS
ncbi:hypothetical protein BpHYR1_033248 [Brachionus plicatilis]|uniref:Uncharacterized protein n=1 Tax=Brachionus plicatilis TaxID=10195 RepID=A0A3M7PHV5_BRAPC|nr:hypothetical protein BpHYR1_033248 [Brachionus plicatilis]